MYWSKENSTIGTSLAVQWLELCTHTAGAWVRSLVGELKPHKPRGKAKNKNKEDSMWYLQHSQNKWCEGRMKKFAEGKVSKKCSPKVLFLRKLLENTFHQKEGINQERKEIQWTRESTQETAIWILRWWWKIPGRPGSSLGCGPTWTGDAGHSGSFHAIKDLVTHQWQSGAT